MYQKYIYEMSSDLIDLKNFFLVNIHNDSKNQSINYIATLHNILIDSLDYYMILDESYLMNYLKQIGLTISLLSSININDENTVNNILISLEENYVN